MLRAYRVVKDALVAFEPPSNGELAGATWIDLLAPTREEELRVEAELGTSIPTREEMQEIEPSSRLYIENATTFLTAVIVSNSDDRPQANAMTFILHDNRLITVRYDTPRSIDLFCKRAAKEGTLKNTGMSVFLGLLDTVIDRLADILEQTGDQLDELSSLIFSAGNDDHSRAYKDQMRELGRKADLIAKVRESLVSLHRMLLFLYGPSSTSRKAEEKDETLQSMQRDIEALSAHSDALVNKVQLLLDAVVGMVSIEQNNIIKIFAVLSVVLMPPTLVASIYGMNFKVMPELEWTYGYPAALLLMIVAGALPWLFFKWKRWL